jgi:superfamily II DNA or RNA helicase
VFLTGTPLVNTPFEVAILFNILRGPLEIIIFKINNFSEDTVDDYIASLIKDERIGWVEVNRRNQSLQVILKLNSWDMEFEQTIRFVETQARNYNAYVNYERTDGYPLFPENEEEFDSFFIKDDNFINKDMFQRRIIGLTSFYQNVSADSEAGTDFPEQLPDKIVKVEMSLHQFELYEKAREIEKQKERKAAQEMKKKLKGEKISTLARVFSREFSNFVFPDDIIRPFQKMQFISAALEEKLEKEKKGKNTNINKINEVIEEKKINKETLDKLIKEALVKLSDPTKPYLKPGKDGLSKYSPKMEEMLNEINKNQKELVLIYSSYRTVEGLEIFSRILNANGYEQYNPAVKQDEKYDYKRYAFFSGQEDVEERKKTIETYVNTENKYGKNIRVLLVSAAGAEGLDLKNIRKVLIMEPYWHHVRLQQIIGRAVRKKSHYDLPENERNVQPIIYLSILSPIQLEISKEKMSTDEHIYNVAQKKLRLNMDVLKAVQESSVDCMLNECDSKKCYQFKGKGLAYMPQLSEDIVYGYNNIITKEVERYLIVSGITDLNEIVYLKEKEWFYGNGKPFDGKPKTIKGKKYGADLATLELFDYDSVKKGIPLLVGKINEIDSKFNEL